MSFVVQVEVLAVGQPMVGDDCFAKAYREKVNGR